MKVQFYKMFLIYDYTFSTTYYQYFSIPFTWDSFFFKRSRDLRIYIFMLDVIKCSDKNRYYEIRRHLLMYTTFIILNTEYYGLLLSLLLFQIIIILIFASINLHPKYYFQTGCWYNLVLMKSDQQGGLLYFNSVIMSVPSMHLTINSLNFLISIILYKSLLLDHLRHIFHRGQFQVYTLIGNVDLCVEM